MAGKDLTGKRMVDRQEAARMYGVSSGTLANWLSAGKGPKAFKVNRKVLYRIEDLELFFTACPVQTVDSLQAAETV